MAKRNQAKNNKPEKQKRDVEFAEEMNPQQQGQQRNQQKANRNNNQ
ncbi:hypothetical protein [Pontibacillus litoralis]|uniref:Uncharacterized protein n=1 Tax=Pontibacillus litoralis JSM 072002 TaxID=1385512 RepID=A0A0A5G8M1_9BACI|nr:hypothetical protein [Pontibacillus litoralis]KGX87493.1 hypothetical protein N784_14705 [Pontibacillus litoralis JSM 072002]